MCGLICIWLYIVYEAVSVHLIIFAVQLSSFYMAGKHNPYQDTLQTTSQPLAAFDEDATWVWEWTALLTGHQE